MRLEDLTTGTSLRGILPDAAVSVVNVQWHGSDACTLVYRTPEGRVADEILYRHDRRTCGRHSDGAPHKSAVGKREVANPVQHSHKPLEGATN